MKNSNYLVTFLIGLIMFSLPAFGSNQDSTKISFSLGISGGLAQYNSFSGDLYGGVTIPFQDKKAEINLGYLYFVSNTDYEDIQDLEFSSHGLFLEGNYYLKKGFYTGLRFAVNFNWVDKESQKKFDNIPDIDSPTFFSGIAGYGQLGLCLPIGNKLGIKLQGQIGIHNYQIAQGWLLIDNSNSDLRKAEIGIYRHAALLYNLSVGLTYNF